MLMRNIFTLPGGHSTSRNGPERQALGRFVTTSTIGINIALLAPLVGVTVPLAGLELSSSTAQVLPPPFSTPADVAEFDATFPSVVVLKKDAGRVQVSFQVVLTKITAGTITMQVDGALYLPGGATKVPPRDPPIGTFSGSRTFTNQNSGGNLLVSFDVVTPGPAETVITLTPSASSDWDIEIFATTQVGRGTGEEITA